jgi:outer membrane receptor protein involved in Fe transport
MIHTIFRRLCSVISLICLILLLSTKSGTAQIRGYIVDANGEPVPGVHVRVIDAEAGTYSDAEGAFLLVWTKFPARIRFSSIGYKSQTILLQSPSENLEVLMEEDLLGLDELTVTTDRLYSPFNREKSIPRNTVDTELINDRIKTTAVDLLRAEPGVFVQQTSAGQGSIYIRGRAGRDVLYLFNGLRMNPAFVRSGQNQYFGLVDPFLTKQIDVYRGPVSVYYGSDALSGGVNVSTAERDFTAEPTLSLDLLSSANVGGTGERSLNTQFAYQTSTWLVEGGISYRNFQFYQLPEGTDERLLFPLDRKLEALSYDFYAYSLNASYRIAENQKISLRSYQSLIEDAARIDRMIMGYDVLDSGNTRPRSAFESNTHPLGFGAHSIAYELITDRPAINSFKIKAGYHRLQDARRDIDYAFNDRPFFADDPMSRDFGFSLSDTLNDENNISNQYLISMDVESSLNRELTLKWGADFSYDYVQSSRGRFDNTGLIANRLPRYPNGSVFIQTGLFTQLDHQVNRRLNLDYGLRYSRFYIDLPFEGTISDRSYDPFENNYEQITASFSAAYGIDRYSSLLLNVSNGFRAPNVADLSEVGIRRSNQFQIATTDLNPEKSINVDLGYRHRGERFSVELFTFWLHYFDRVRRQPTGNIVNADGAFIRTGNSTQNADEFIEVSSVNEDALNIFGIEFAGSMRLSSNIESGLTFSYIRGTVNEFDGSTEPVDRIPPANGIIFLGYRPSEWLELKPQLRYAFEQNRLSQAEIDDSRINPEGTDGFTNLQMLVNIKPGNQFSLQLIGDNLLNQAYREHTSSLDGLGRNVSITARYSF